MEVVAGRRIELAGPEGLIPLPLPFLREADARTRGTGVELRLVRPARVDVHRPGLRRGDRQRRAERRRRRAARRAPRRVEVDERQAVLHEAVELGRRVGALRPAAGLGERLSALVH